MDYPLYAYKNQHRGETGLLICNGPGLTNIPVKGMMEKYPSMAMNRFHFYADQESAYPTYYACLGNDQLRTSDQRVALYPMLHYVEVAFLSRLWIHYFSREDHVESILSGHFYGATPQQCKSFSLTPLIWLGVGATQTYPCLQLLYYFGFATVLIIGMDHHYPEGSKKHFYTDELAKDWDAAPGPHYETSKDWAAAADEVYRIARYAFELDGRRIINLSTPTKCDVFTKDRVENWYTDS